VKTLESETQKEVKATERKLNIILDHVREGSIITAAGLIKQLAIALDQRGYAERLEGMLRAAKDSPKHDI